jgi:hypothetical protein
MNGTLGGHVGAIVIGEGLVFAAHKVKMVEDLLENHGTA